MLRNRIMKFLKAHSEWLAFFIGLLLMASMDPSTKGFSFCLFDMAGIPYCPGEGLGHSIAYLFRGELEASLSANLFGPLAVAVLSLRILSIWKVRFFNKGEDKTNTIGV